MNACTSQRLKLRSQFALLLKFFTAPSKAVDEMSRQAPVAASFLLLSVGGLCLQWALIPFVEQAASHTLDEGLSAAAVEQSLQMMGKIQLLALFFYPFTLTAKWVLLGVMLALFCQLLGGQTSLRQGLSISAHASLLPLLQTAQVYLILLLTGLDSVRHPGDLRPAIGLDLLWSAEDPLTAALLHNVNPFEIAYLVFLLAAISRTNPAFSNFRTLAAALPFWLMTLAVRVVLGSLGQADSGGAA